MTFEGGGATQQGKTSQVIFFTFLQIFEGMAVEFYMLSVKWIPLKAALTVLSNKPFVGQRFYCKATMNKALRVGLLGNSNHHNSYRNLFTADSL